MLRVAGESNFKLTNLKVKFMKILLLLIVGLAPSVTYGQFGVNFHQSNLPFAGINYEFAERFRPEVRIGTDNYFEDLSVEGIFTYDILNKDNYEFYGGLGARAEDFTGLVIPIGLNFYPFSTKNFGFHIELAPILGDENILRGSWGIRYRFKKSATDKLEE